MDRTRCVHAGTLFTGRGVVSNAFLVYRGSLIAGVSGKVKGELEGEYACVTPAFIDPHSHIGMHRWGEPGAEAEANEHLESILGNSDALDSVQMDDDAFRDAVEAGVLYSCILPGSGNIIGGLSAVVRNYADNGSDALIGRAGVKAAFGYNPMSTIDWKGKRPSTRMGALAVLRTRLEEVRQKILRQKGAKGKKREEVIFPPEETIIREILERRLRLRVHVHKIDDIAALLRVVDEFNLDVSVEHALGVHSSDMFRKLKKRSIPVVYGPVDAFAYKVELKHENWRNVRCLIDSGVDFGLMTDHPVVLARQLLLQTRWFLRAGCTRQQAVEIITRKNALVAGVSKILGTLESGKWASFVCWNGDPFDMASYPVAVYGEGRPLHRE